MIEPPCQHRGAVPVTDTGQSSTCNHDAVRASTAVAVVSSGLYRVVCGPLTTFAAGPRQALVDPGFEPGVVVVVVGPDVVVVVGGAEVVVVVVGAVVVVVVVVGVPVPRAFFHFVT